MRTQNSSRIILLDTFSLRPYQEKELAILKSHFKVIQLEGKKNEKKTEKAARHSQEDTYVH